MALRNVLTLRRPRSGRLEGRTALIQAPSFVVSVSSAVNLVRNQCPEPLVGNGQRFRGGDGVMH
jgi:hypothetical protein